MASAYYDNAEDGFSCSGCTQWWNQLQSNPRYIGRDCAGNIIGSPPTEETGDITQAGWQSVWQGVAASQDGSLTALFADGGGDPGAGSYPCGSASSSYLADLVTMFDGTNKPVIANNVFETSAIGTDWHTIDAAPNVIGAMADSDCYVDANAYGMGSADFAIIQTMHSYGYPVDDWTQRENDELYLASAGKQFWCLIGASGTASTETALRIYAYASLMLTFDLHTTGYFTYWKTDTVGQLEVYPETGLVPANPVVGTPLSVTALQVGGVYAREYNDCYYRGTDEGRCAFVVNPTGSTQNWPALSRSYGHTMALSGGGVLEGGGVSFSAAAPPAILFSGTAVIAFQ
jgi:hypothetical protein